MISRKAFGIAIVLLGSSAIGLGVADSHMIPTVCGMGLISCGIYFLRTRGPWENDDAS